MGSEWSELVVAARRAADHAYAPYSHLRVGAALQGKSGRVYTGCNVENASFGLTICAERAVIFHAIAEGERDFTRLAIATPDAPPLAPCGACRQVLAEFARDLQIRSEGAGSALRDFTLADLLPHAFDLPPAPG
jgi:cytidine deaminase